MPSPVGHAIGGVAAAWFAAGRPPQTRQWLGQALVFGAIGTLPDIDLLFGAHSGATHSIGAAAIAAAVAWIVAWMIVLLQRATPPDLAVPDATPLRPGWMALATSSAWMSHVLLDWLGDDTSAPFGVMALWPFSREHFVSPLSVMPAITRRYWLPGFWMQNFRALVFELMVLLPVLAAVWWVRGFQPRRRR